MELERTGDGLNWGWGSSSPAAEACRAAGMFVVIVWEAVGKVAVAAAGVAVALLEAEVEGDVECAEAA